MKRFESLKHSSDPKTLEEFATHTGRDIESVQRAATTLRTLEKGLKNPTTVDEDFSKKFKRVRVGKLLVPRSFAAHAQLVCELMEVDEETFWQLIIMEAMNLYAENAGGIVDVVNKVEEGVLD